MNYVGTWKFHSIGLINENDEMVYVGAEEYIASPMPYIDETDEEAVADELRERRQQAESKLAVCEDKKLYMLMPLPEGVSKEEVDAAVAAGHVKLYDGMMTDEPMTWGECEGELYLEVGTDMSDDGWVKLSDGEFLAFMNIRYAKEQ